MKRALPLLLLSTITITSINAQNDRFAYAITDVAKEGAGWNALRKLDLQTGDYSTVLFNGTTEQTAFDAVTKKQLTLPADARYGTMLNTPFGTGVAAAAYDKKHNRLYFTPMFVDQLRYVDLKTMKVYYVTNQAFTRQGNMHNDEGKIITRMVITPDGNGYAISNDGNTFVRFSTGKKPKIEQLGALVDDPSNNGISVHNRCSSFGGDMISDDNGKLYILTARNHVFSVDAETKVAKHLGAINGLPGRFTVNGAVVNADGALLVSSAVDGDAYYTVNPKDWSAAKYENTKGIFRASDLANSNYLSTRTTTKSQEMTTIAKPEQRFAKLISVYPNPVTESRITLQFNKVPQGDYTIELMDVLGRSVQQRRVTINSEEQVQALELQKNHSKGVYMVKVFDRENQSVFTQKVMVQ